MSMMAQQREKLKKIMKFEKIMKRLCKDIGIDKKTLLSIFINPSQMKEVEGGSNVKNESGVKDQSFSRDSGTINMSGNSGPTQVNTGAAAQIAYNNIIPNTLDHDA